MDLATGKIKQKEFEEKTQPILKECCKKYGYSMRAYKCKAKKLEKEQNNKIDDALKINSGGHFYENKLSFSFSFLLNPYFMYIRTY